MLAQSIPTPSVPQPPALPATNAPQAIYRALRDQRDVLGDQLRNAQNLREQLVGQLSENPPAVVKTSIEKRIANVDERIANLDKQIASADQAVANSAAIPGAIVREPPLPRQGPPDAVYALSGMFMVIVFLPLSIAFTRRIWRRSAKATVVLPPEVAQRMESIERGVEAIAIEVERIGEGQRFLSQLLGDRQDLRALGVGAAQPLPVGEREKVEVRRS